MNTVTHRGWIAFLILLIALPLLVHLYSGQYNRAIADDFCWTGKATARGFISMLDWEYHNWSWHYAAIAAQGIIGMANGWRFVPSAFLLLWWGGALLLAYQAARLLKFGAPWLAAMLISMVFVYAANVGTASIYASLYWTSGAVSYTLPLIVLTFQLNLFAAVMGMEGRSRPPLAHLALLAGLTITAGGFSSLYAAFQVAFYGLLCGSVFLFGRQGWKQRILMMGGTAAAFSGIALLLLLSAPGNAVRVEALGSSSTIPEALALGLRLTVGFVPTAAVFFSPAAVMTAFVVSGVVGLLFHPLSPRQKAFFQRNGIRLLGLSALVMYLLLFAVLFTGAYALRDMVPTTAHILPQVIFIVGVMAWGYIMGLALHKEHAANAGPVVRLAGRTLLVLVLLAGPVTAAVQAVAYEPMIRTFAAEWDLRDAAIRQAAAEGAEHFVLTPFTYDLIDRMYIGDINDGCLPVYYHLRSFSRQASG